MVRHPQKKNTSGKKPLSQPNVNDNYWWNNLKIGNTIVIMSKHSSFN